MIQYHGHFYRRASWRDILDQNDGFIYHVTCEPWDGHDLESLQFRIPDYEERLDFIREKWPEHETNYTPEEYDFSEADQIHCNWTLEAAEEWRDLYCLTGEGQILEIAWRWGDLRVEPGQEQDRHPVVRNKIPARCIEVVA